MARQKLVRLVANVPPWLVLRFTKLSEEYGVSRSELYRLTLERGFPATKAWVEKRYAEVRHGLAGRDSPSALARMGAASGGSTVNRSPVEALTAFADALIMNSQSMDAVQFERMLVAQAAVLGLTGPTSRGIIEQLVAGLPDAASSPGGGSSDPEPPVDGFSDVDGVPGPDDDHLPQAVDGGGGVDLD